MGTQRASTASDSNDQLPSSTTATTRPTKNIIHSTLTNISKMWRNTTETVDQILEETGAYTILDQIAQHLARHPYLAVGASAAIISFTLPFIIFMIFAIATVLMTFTGFVIIEGTLITLASVLLFGFLGAVVLVFVFFAIALLGGYFGFIHIYDMIRPPTLKQLTKTATSPTPSNHDASNGINP